MVVAATFLVAKDLADLIAVTHALAEQTLHRIFRRGLQEVAAVTGDRGGQRGEVHVRHRSLREKRRFHFQNMTVGKKLPTLLKHLCSGCEACAH